MQIYLARNNQQAGPYSLEQINQMLASQQILLTDLVWHQGMTEWKALGELTQGKSVYEPAGYVPPVSTVPEQPFGNIGRGQNQKIAQSTELASFNSRIIAKILDLLLWLPAMVIPSFFFKPEQLAQLTALQQKMQTATGSEQAIQLQHQLMSMIPQEAWITMGVYILCMLAVQAYLLAKTGQSAGKKIARIKIVDAETSEKVSLMRVFTLRTVVFIVLNLMFMPFSTIIDYAFSFGPKRQTLHDRLARTIVIKQ